MIHHCEPTNIPYYQGEGNDYFMNSCVLGASRMTMVPDGCTVLCTGDPTGVEMCGFRWSMESVYAKGRSHFYRY